MAVSVKKDVLGGKYCLERVIGKGGSGCIYLAMDYVLGKKWAVKELSKSDAAILNEVEMMRLLDHPMLPRIVDRIETAEKVYLVMDYLKGVSLQNILYYGKKFSVSQVLHLGLQLCDVLGYLHTHEPKVLYCDMKPSNILLTSGGQIKLIDFGGALFCREDNEKQAVVVLTKGFAAPEQYEGTVTIASDIYGLGATLAAICPDKIPRQLKKIIDKCQNTKPQKRYKSIKNVSKALRIMQLQKRGISQAGKISLLIFLMLFLGTSMQDILGKARSKAFVEAIAATRYEAAIEIFPNESKPYLGILKKYKQRGETAAGILEVENLLNLYASDDLEKQRVYFSIGKLYFSGNIFDETFGVDYEMAYKYFALVQSETYQHIDWYQNMAKNLCDFGSEIDWQQRRSDLERMERACMTMPEDEKIVTLYEVAMVYLTNRYYLTDDTCDPLNESTRLLEMCRDLSRKNENNLSNNSTVSDINISIARNYLLAGLQSDDEKMLQESYGLYEKELETQTQQGICLEIMRKLAYIKRYQKDYQSATVWYEKAIAENQADVETYCQYILMKLIEEKDIPAAKELMAKVSQLEGCESNKNYQTIKIRMEAIS